MTDIDDKFRYLGQLIGPKSENEDTIVKLVTTVLLDYLYWRKNYFPNDPLAIPAEIRRRFESEKDKLAEATINMAAELRRSFPFYSPRYIGHQQSETTIASIVGAFAGTLYNSNNVTTESGNATVEMELDACEALLRLLGFKFPPDPNKVVDYHDYLDKLSGAFGWCHLTSGGTVATIEALWAARAVKYFPLAVRDVCRDHKIELQVAMPGAEARARDKARRLSEERKAAGKKGAESQEKVEIETRDIGGIEDDRDLLRLRPMEVMTLLGKFSRALKKQLELAEKEVSKKVWELLDESPYSPRNGVRHAFAVQEPVILVSGAAHYSVKKAADLLGLGKNGVWLIPTDAHFRMDIAALEQALDRAEAEDKCVLAVVAVAGTTEEGAMDPLKQIVELKKRREISHDQSFWIHVDAAWGGFMRSLFVEDDDGTRKLSRKHFRNRAKRIHNDLLEAKKPLREKGVCLPPEVSPSRDLKEWVNQLVAALGRAAAAIGLPVKDHKSDDGLYFPIDEKIEIYFKGADQSGDYRIVLDVLEKLFAQMAEESGDPAWSPGAEYFGGPRDDDFMFDVREDCRVIVKPDPKKKGITLSWPPPLVGQALLAINSSDSVTVDPHKMGYTVYPCGAVAFRSDLVRHFLRHEAPYITSERDGSKGASRASVDGMQREKLPPHLPVRHAERQKKEGQKDRIVVKTEAFAQYTLEGSRPSSAATSLWLSQKTLPFNRNGHGRLIRSSILAGQYLYEMLKDRRIRDPDVMSQMIWKYRPQARFDFVMFSDLPPDTNIVIFGVKERYGEDRGLRRFNDLNETIYRKFSILAEMGDRAHSYSQRFFLSKTEFRSDCYPFSSLRSFFERHQLAVTEQDYNDDRVVVLRATVMNPYILPLREHGQADLVIAFVDDLLAAAGDVVPPAELKRAL